MPVNFPCTKCRKACKKNVREGEESICCDKCNKWVHFRCTDLTNDELNRLISSENPYTCGRCLKTCLKCKKYCRVNQKVHVCKTCMQQIHENCLTNEYGGFLNDPDSGTSNFFCFNCSPILANSLPDSVNPTTSYPIENIELISNPVSLNDSSIDTASMLASSDDEISDAHSSDFAYESDSESDTDLRGLDFSSLPVQTTTCKTFKHSNHHLINVRTINYKYPCGVCYGPCRENTQDSIQCSLCDEWVHQKCTNLTYNQFLEYCDPNNADKPYHCDWCEFGSSACPTNQTCLSASAISSLDSSDIFNL